MTQKTSIETRFNPAKWHSMLSRRSFVEKFNYWSRRPRGSIVRSVEFMSLDAPLLSQLFTNNSLVNLGISFSKIFNYLTVNTKTGTQLPYSKRHFYLLHETTVDLKNSFFQLHSGHFLAPFHSDRQFMSGMYIDDLTRMNRRKKVKVVKGTFFVLPMQDYYFHFLIEYLPRLIEANLSIPSIRVISLRKQPRYVHEALKVFQIRLEETDDRFLNLEFVHVAEETEKLPQSVIYNCFNTSPVAPDVGLLSELFGNNWNGGLLLTRKGQPRFSIDLENELFNPLVEEGFRVIDPRELTFSQQIQVFRHARTLIGFHGGAMANMVFMPRGSQIFEIYAKSYDGYNPEFFKELAIFGGHDYRAFTKMDSSKMDEVIKKIKLALC